MSRAVWRKAIMIVNGRGSSSLSMVLLDKAQGPCVNMRRFPA
jgi:hypothetical protein